IALLCRSIMKRRIKATSGPKSGMVREVEDDLGLGRDAANAFCLDDVSASRLHSKILVRGEDVILKDLGGRNGTFVNGKRLPPHGESTLKHGDRFRIGISLFVYLEREDSSKKAAALMEA